MEFRAETSRWSWARRDIQGERARESEGERKGEREREGGDQRETENDSCYLHTCSPTLSSWLLNSLVIAVTNAKHQEGIQFQRRLVDK